MVIGDRPLDQLVPLYKDPRSDLLVTQFSMKYVEQAGLVKFDFLGLTTLTIIDRALGFLRAQGIDVDIFENPARRQENVRDDFARRHRRRVHLRNHDLSQRAPAIAPDRFEDLIAIQALNRPGPMANIPDYCARKRGAAWSAPDPAIHEILEETYGIIIYQEQVMQIAQVMAGYTLAGADLLRRAMGKKIRAEMDAQRKIFCEGALTLGHTEEKANEIFDLMAKFADYGFNKSHAAAYALVSYQTAYLRANYPVALLAACMSLSIANTDKLATLRGEAIRLGIKVLPPDVNKSEADFRPEQQEDGSYAIRYALGAVKTRRRCRDAGAGEGEGRTTVQGFRRISPRASTPNRSPAAQIEILAKAGAFDTLVPNRAQVFAAAETIMRLAQSLAEERSSGQIGLFGGGAPEPVRLPNTPDWPDVDRLANEAEAVGFHISSHPLDMYAVALKRLEVVPSSQIERRAQAGATRIKLAGTMGAKKERITRTGSRMAWITLSDVEGSYEVTLFSEVLNRVRENSKKAWRFW